MTAMRTVRTSVLIGNFKALTALSVAAFCVGLAGIPAFITTPAIAQRSTTDSVLKPGSSPSDNVDSGSSGPSAKSGSDNNTSPAYGPLDDTRECGDTLSAALQQDGAGTPCWADIRTVDHWNTMKLANNATLRGGPGFLPPGNESQSGFSFAAGGLGGVLFDHGNNSGAYGGAGALSGFVQKPRWELMYEDGGALAGYQVPSTSGSSFSGLNRGALRANGEVNSRWLWQGSLTNAYGSDTLRLFAPLDYRTVGATESPVTDTVAYGLHSGNLVDQQEDFKMRFAESRRTNWNFSFAHTLRYYSDDGVNAQTIRARADYLHATSQNSAIGFLAGAARQPGPSPCTLGGAGMLGLLQWGSHASVSVSGSANGASSDCGKAIQFTGDAALFIRIGNHDDVYVTGNRDLSGGVVEKLALLDSAGGGIRHQFSRTTSLRLSGAAIYGTDPKSNLTYNGTFAEAAVTYPLGAGFIQETSYRHYQVSRIPGGDNRNLVTFTLWWSPRKNPQGLRASK
jgi:hypothetical protein